MRCCSSSRLVRSQWAIFGGCRGIEMFFLLLLLFCGASPVSSTDCADLRTAMDFTEIMNCDGNEILLDGGNGTLTLSNAADAEIQEIFNPVRRQIRTLDGSLMLVGSHLIKTLPLRIRWSPHKKPFVIIENNPFLTKIEPFFTVRATGNLQVTGNRRLAQDSIDELKKVLTDGLKKTTPHFTTDSYVQDFGECLVPAPLNSFDELEACVYIKGDLSIDSKTLTDSQFPSNLTKIDGCIKIIGTNLASLDFLENLKGSSACTAGNELSKNSICIHPEFEDVIKRNFQKIKIDNPKECVAECSSAYLLQSENAKCVVVTDSLTITGMKAGAKTKHLEGIKTILGRLVIINNDLERINFFKSLETVNASRTDDKPAIDIKFNDNMKEFSLPALKEIVTEPHQKALYVDMNGKYNMTDAMRDEYTKKFGKDRVSIYVYEVVGGKTKKPIGEDETGTSNNLTETAGTAVESSTESSGLGGGAIAGIVIVVIVILVIVVGGVAGGVAYWRIAKKKKREKALQEAEEAQEAKEAKETKEMKEKKAASAAVAATSNETKTIENYYKSVGISGLHHDRKRLRFVRKLPHFEELEDFFKNNKEKIKSDTENRKRAAPVVGRTYQPLMGRLVVPEDEDGTVKPEGTQYEAEIAVEDDAGQKLVAGQIIDEDPAEIDMRAYVDYMPQQSPPNKEETKNTKDEKNKISPEKVDPKRTAAGESEKEEPPKSQKKSKEESKVNSKQQNGSKQKSIHTSNIIANGKLVIKKTFVDEEDSFPLKPYHRRITKQNKREKEYADRERPEAEKKRPKYYADRLTEITKYYEMEMKALGLAEKEQKEAMKVHIELIEDNTKVVVNKDRKRNNKGVIHHPNSMAAAPFLSRAEASYKTKCDGGLENPAKVPNPCKIYGFRYEKTLKVKEEDEGDKKPDKVPTLSPYLLSTPVVYEQSFDVTAKRMMDHPQEMIDETIAFDQKHNRKQRFDLSHAYIQMLSLEHGGGDTALNTRRMSTLAYGISVHEFKPLTGIENSATEKNICIEKPKDDCSDVEFLASMIKACLECDLKRWMVLDKRDIKRLCSLAKNKLGKQALVYMNDRARIIGEVRGKFDDLRMALSIPAVNSSEDGECREIDRFSQLIGKINSSVHPTSQLSLVFLGNYLGFDVTNVETICLLFALKAYYGKKVVLLRGMTEWREMNVALKFYEELKCRYKEDYEELYNDINEVFDNLPLACRIYGNVLCVHGGIVPEISQLEKVELPIKELVPDTLPFNLVFGHPNYTVKTYFDNLDLGAGYYFGEEALYSVMDKLKIDTIFMSKALSTGFGFFGTGRKLFTLCSASNLEVNAPKLQIAVADCLYEQLFIRVAYQKGTETFSYFKDDEAKSAMPALETAGVQNKSDVKQSKLEAPVKNKQEKSGANQKSAPQQPKSALKTGNDKPDKSGPNQKSAPQQPKSALKTGNDKPDKSGPNQSAVQPSGAKSAAASGAGGASKAQEPPRKLPSKPGSTSTNTGAKDAASKM